MQLADHVLEIILLFKEDQMGTKEGGRGGQDGRGRCICCSKSIYNHFPFAHLFSVASKIRRPPVLPQTARGEEGCVSANERFLQTTAQA